MVDYQLFSQQVAVSVSSFSPKQVPLWCALSLSAIMKCHASFFPLHNVHLCCHGALVWGVEKSRGIKKKKREDTSHDYENISVSKTFPWCDMARFRPQSTGQRGNWKKRRPCCRFYSDVAENNAVETAPPAICASSISAINSKCVGCVWAPHIALQDLHDPMNINHLTRKTFSETGSRKSLHVKEWGILF